MGSDSGANYWLIVTIIGPILLLAVIAWVIMRNKQSKVEKDITEQGTRDVYAEEQHIHENERGSGL